MFAKAIALKRLGLNVSFFGIIGNDVFYNLNSAKLGIETYLVTDYMINQQNLEQYLRRWTNEGKKLAICTKGQDGVICLEKDKEIIKLEGDKLNLIVTNGAGDNFIAGFVYDYYNEGNIENSLKMVRIDVNSCILSGKIVSDELSLDFLRKNI